MVLSIKKVLVFLLIIIALLTGGVYYYRKILINNRPAEKVNQELSLLDAEKEQMYLAAKSYIKVNSVAGLEFDLKIIKIVNQWALLEAIPKNNATDNAGVIMEKVNNQWIPRAFGTIFPEWSKKVPALFE